MIKFIASDLDGTLLTPDKTLPEEIFPLVEKLHEKGVIFAPASGRQLPNLKKLFEPVLDKIAIIAENGALVWHGGKIIYSNPTPKDKMRDALNAVRSVKGIYPLLSCADCAYYDSDFKPFVSAVHRSYNSAAKRDLDEVAEQEIIMKISIWDEFPPCSDHGGKLLMPKIHGLRTVLSGYEWFDVSGLTANKGNALQATLSILNIDKEQCMAFGDHMNDVEMLEICGQPYVTANAYEGLKKIFKNTVPSNAELGVITALKNFLSGQPLPLCHFK